MLGHKCLHPHVCGLCPLSFLEQEKTTAALRTSKHLSRVRHFSRNIRGHFSTSFKLCSAFFLRQVFSKVFYSLNFWGFSNAGKRSVVGNLDVIFDSCVSTSFFHLGPQEGENVPPSSWLWQNRFTPSSLLEQVPVNLCILASISCCFVTYWL